MVLIVFPGYLPETKGYYFGALGTLLFCVAQTSNEHPRLLLGVSLELLHSDGHLLECHQRLLLSLAMQLIVFFLLFSFSWSMQKVGWISLCGCTPRVLSEMKSGKRHLRLYCLTWLWGCHCSLTISTLSRGMQANASTKPCPYLCGLREFGNPP